jgi:hypothetical protein
MRALNAYIDQQNKWNALFNGRQYEVNTAGGRRPLAAQIDAALSPELGLTVDAVKKMIKDKNTKGQE